MSAQTQNVNLNPYSNTPIKNLEYIQNKALVIAPFEITKNGLLDPDLMLDTPGIININLYKKMVAGEDKEPTADQFKTIKYMSEIDSSNRISSFDIPVIFKYDKETNTRIIEKDLKNLPLDYKDLPIDISNIDFSQLTGSNGFYCICCVQKIQKPGSTAFTEVSNEDFLFMIPSIECREIPELVEFDLLDSDNKVINIKRFGEPGESVYSGDIYKDKVSLLLDGNDLTDKTGKTITNIGVTVDTNVKKYGSGSLKFNGSSYMTLPSSDDFDFGSGDFTIESYVNFKSAVTDVCIFDGVTVNNFTLNIYAGNCRLVIAGKVITQFPFSPALNTYTWYHIVVVRKNSIISLYLNGELKSSVHYSNSCSFTTELRLGRYGDPYTSYFNGYIDDLRITKGVARYTDNFTPVVNINEQEQGYRIYPVIKIQETITSPKYYLGSKYQRNLMEILSHSIKSKRIISNLKDMYLVDNQCIQTLNKINVLLTNDQMIKFTERLYNLGTPLREKLNSELILEYLSTPVSGSQNNDIVATLKTSLIEDYNFTQEEIDNLNNNLNTFKSRARIALATPTIDNDKFKFNLPKVFIDGNKSKIEKKNLLVFGTNAGFNKFNLTGYTAPYSNISKRGQTDVLDVNDLLMELPTNSTFKNENDNNVVGLSQNSDTSLYMYFTENNNVFISGRIEWTSTWEQDSVYYTALQLDLSNVTTESKIKMVDCSERTMLILYENGDLYACGSNAYGVIPVSSMIPILIKQNIKHISAGSQQFAILDTNNDLYTIGRNDQGNFNTGDTTNRSSWFKSASNVKSYGFSTRTLAVVYNDDTLWMCGGAYTNFQSSAVVKTLTKITIPAKVKKIISQGNYTIILFENNSIRCSGYSDSVWTGQRTNNPRINVNPGFTATDIYGGHQQGIIYVSNNKLYGVPEFIISANINSSGYTDLNSYFGDIQDIQDIKMYEISIKIIKKNKNLYSIGRNWAGTFGIGGSDVTYSTLQLTNPRKFLTDAFKDILSNYKQQIPFTVIPLSTDIKDINNKPVFEKLDNITGFEPTDIVIDIPNVL